MNTARRLLWVAVAVVVLAAPLAARADEGSYYIVEDWMACTSMKALFELSDYVRLEDYGAIEELRTAGECFNMVLGTAVYLVEILPGGRIVELRGRGSRATFFTSADAIVFKNEKDNREKRWFPPEVMALPPRLQRIYRRAEMRELLPRKANTWRKFILTIKTDDLVGLSFEEAEKLMKATTFVAQIDEKSGEFRVGLMTDKTGERLFCEIYRFAVLANQKAQFDLNKAEALKEAGM